MNLADMDVQIVEVGARDGLQNAPELVTTDDKLALVGRALAAGVRRIEVASFVHPRLVPQMADAEAVVAALPDRADVSYIGLCLNERGVQRALATLDGGRRGVDEIGCVLVASDSFGRRNQGQGIKEGLVENHAMLRRARDGGLKGQVTIAAAFGCPFEGMVKVETVLGLAQEMADAGATEIALADTIGAAVPAQVEEWFGRVREVVPGLPLRAHFHNTRGMGIANAWAAYRVGVRVFDSSLGGLGGCPFAPKATGNIATEELAYLFGRAGIATGLDLDRLIDASNWLGNLLARPMPSLVARAGNWPPAIG